MAETWLQDVDSVSITTSWSLFQFDRKGGGTGVLYNEIVEMKFIDGEEKRSFEFSEWNCKIANQTLKVIAVYRPPYSQAHAVTSNMFEFFEEDFLEKCDVRGNIINYRRF